VFHYRYLSEIYAILLFLIVHNNRALLLQIFWRLGMSVSCLYRIPLIWHSLDQAGAAALSNIPDYQMVPRMTKVFIAKFLLPSENMHLSVIFISSSKDIAVFNYHRPKLGFSFRAHCCKSRAQHIVQVC
jgi:hypothetical protein